MPHGLATEDLLVLNLLVVLDERAHVVAPAHHVAVCLYHPALFRARLAKALLVLLLAEHSVLLLLAALLRLNGLVQLVELERYLEHINNLILLPNRLYPASRLFLPRPLRRVRCVAPRLLVMSPPVAPER